MANLYATKSLGRTWTPSLRSDTAKQGRFDLGSGRDVCWSRVWRGKAAERLALAALLVLGGLYLIFASRPPASGDRAGEDEAGKAGVAGSRAYGMDTYRYAPFEQMDWSQYAYSTYATSPTHLCNSLVLLSSLQEAGSKADRVLLYPRRWQIQEKMVDTLEATATYAALPRATDGEGDWTNTLLRKARDGLGAKLMPVDIISSAPDIARAPIEEESVDHTWEAGFTKLLALNMTQYSRVLAIDTDALLRKHMDDLFTLPTEGAGWTIAMPRAYWLSNDTEGAPGEGTTLSSGLLLAQPSEKTFSRVSKAFDERKEGDWDMEILNKLFGRTAAVLPHRPYLLLSGEFRSRTHTAYLGEEGEAWDADGVLEEARYVHFSDWPLGKPWELEAAWAHVSRGEPTSVKEPKGVTRQDMSLVQPKCRIGRNGKLECRERDVWRELYEHFWAERAHVCGIEFMRWERDQRLGFPGAGEVKPVGNVHDAASRDRDSNMPGNEDASAGV
ncbi:hypothetical protein MBLNU230_g1720t1 [Neophaeotheca triangularis]